jgi:hypothetical protein
LFQIRQLAVVGAVGLAQLPRRCRFEVIRFCWQYLIKIIAVNKALLVSVVLMAVHKQFICED